MKSKAFIQSKSINNVIPNILSSNGFQFGLLKKKKFTKSLKGSDTGKGGRVSNTK